MKRANRLLACFALALLCVGTARAQNPQVTFQFDASTLVNACQFGPNSHNPNSFVSLRGSFNGYAERTHELTDADGDGIYTVTLAVAPGEHNYKFYHSVLGWEDGIAGSTHPDGNRQITVTAGADVTVPAVTFNKTFDDLCGQTPTSVTFQLDAADLVAKCQLGPNSTDPDAFVSARGNFNSYNERDLVFADADGDGLYTATVELLPGDYDFKLYHSDLSWENGVQGSTHPDGNRQFSVTGGETLVLPVMTFNKDSIPNVCGATSQCVDVFFRVNMGAQIASGSFDPAVNLVTVAGPHVGWSTTADTLEAELRDPNIYSTLVTIENQLVPGEVEYKFVSGTRGESPGGWESFNGNRFLAVSGDEEDFDGGTESGEYELEELIESSMTLDCWLEESGEAVPTLLRVSDKEVCATTPTGDLSPHSSSHEGYMGNYGNGNGGGDFTTWVQGNNETTFVAFPYAPRGAVLDTWLGRVPLRLLSANAASR